MKVSQTTNEPAPASIAATPLRFEVLRMGGNVARPLCHEQRLRLRIHWTERCCPRQLGVKATTAQSAAGEAAPMRRKSGQAEGGPMLMAGVDAWRASPGLYLTLLPTRTTPPSGRSLRILSGTCPPEVSLLTCSRIRE